MYCICGWASPAPQPKPFYESLAWPPSTEKSNPLSSKHLFEQHGSHFSLWFCAPCPCKVWHRHTTVQLFFFFVVKINFKVKQQKILFLLIRVITIISTYDNDKQKPQKRRRRNFFPFKISEINQVFLLLLLKRKWHNISYFLNM